MGDVQRPLLIAGMHRSGTSMMGGLMARMGWGPGRRQVPADARNARGYFEDADIVAFHGRLFRSLLPQDARGHIDWGWSEEAPLDRGRLDEFAAEARKLASERGSEEGPWGFKDPRTTLLLDFWDEVLPDARFLLVYRFPWEVADSMQRLGAGVFERNPSYGYRIWEAYNAALLEFHERHAERCLLVSANAVRSHLSRFQELACERLGMGVAPVDLAQGVDAELFKSGDPLDPRADLTAIGYPEAMRILEALEARSDLPAEGLWKRERATAPGLGSASEEEVDVSIVVPTYNDGVVLLDALASVERARPPRSELILVDDGSTDPESRRILDALSEYGYRVHRKENGGLSSARNAGIERARGRYILPLDADNRLRSGFIERAVRELEQHSDLAVVYGDRQLFGGVDRVQFVPEFELTKLMGGNYIDACALFRRELWEELGGYDTFMVGFEDWEFWLHAAKRGYGFLHLPFIAFDYRVQNESLVTRVMQPGLRQELLGHLLAKHGELFHGRVPRPLRLPSSMISRLSPNGLGRAARGLETRAFWRPLWSLIGPGGYFAEDRAHRKSGFGRWPGSGLTILVNNRPMGGRPPLVVAGAHRSGTTLTVQLLERLGAFTGARCDPNHEPYFFLRRNEWLLRRAGGAWDHPRPILPLLEDDDFVSAAARILREDTDSYRFAGFRGGAGYLRTRGTRAEARVWGWKDPRNTFTLPIWARVFPGAKLVLVERNGVDASQSLYLREAAARRAALSDGNRLRMRPLARSLRDAWRLNEKMEPFVFSTRCQSWEDAFELWEEYASAGRVLLESYPGPVFRVSFEGLLEDPQATLGELAEFCELRVPENTLRRASERIQRQRAGAFLRDPLLVEHFERVKESTWMRELGYSAMARPQQED